MTSPSDRYATLPDAHIDGRLVPPSAALEDSFIEALHEGFRRGAQPRLKRKEIDEITGDFEGYLERITDQGGDITLPNGVVVPKVPFSLHWLVVHDVFVGELSFRHQLNDWLRASGGHMGYGIRPSWQGQGWGKRLLALGLVEARRLGLDQVLVTCQDDNIASAQIIESNGGVLDSVVEDGLYKCLLRRYWVPCGSVPTA